MNDVDGIIIDNNGLKYFLCMNDLIDYCNKNNFITNDDDDIPQFDLDKLDIWLSEEDKTVNSEFMLDIWNIASDAMNSTNVKFIGDSRYLTNIYNKLFWGNDIEVIHKGHSHYNPVLNSEEIKGLTHVMIEILDYFKIQFLQSK
jgi:hypothetical protein